MAPPKVDATRVLASQRPFNVTVSSVFVLFQSAGDGNEQVLEMDVMICYDKPVIFLRFGLPVFDHSNGRKEEKSLYLYIRRPDILSLDSSKVDDKAIAQLKPKIPSKLGHDIKLVRFHLKHPGKVIEPIQECSFKSGSSRKSELMSSLAELREFNVFMRYKSLSEKRIKYLRQALASPITPSEEAKQRKKDDWCLSVAYGGLGGKVRTTNTATAGPNAIDNYDSESGDSTIATATPPPYPESRVRSVKGSVTESEPDDGVPHESPPRYEAVNSDSPDHEGETLGKRRRDSADIPTTTFSRRPFGMTFDHILRRMQNLEEENGKLKAAMAEMQKTQQMMQEMFNLHSQLQESQFPGKIRVVNRNPNVEKRLDKVEEQVAEVEEQIAELQDGQQELQEQQDIFEMDADDKIDDKIDAKLHDKLDARIEDIKSDFKDVMRHAADDFCNALDQL
ncbi:hypothetical protein N7495_000800 [Penicillium taxi]|uniref:uncharacterized protein n=1 Tax=Penicillium taxi TaxID=168475 RepID=UPI0025457A3A|nr:uncharacterized protein N7495_000800 [Penicillium taxi]KAJ5908118.1 hypothetical protein N7495_000800 [Penicillium taxi]